MGIQQTNFMTSPTARSLAYLREKDYVCQVVEHFNTYSKTRIDLFNAIDLVAIHPYITGVLGVQATTKDNISARVKKCEAEPKMKIWLAAGNRLEVHGWGLMGGRGKRKTYHLKIVEIK